MSYTYTKHSWEDKPSSNTPITAAKLNEIEEGIYQANTNKVDKVSGKQLSTNDFSNQDVTDLAEAKKNSHTHSNKSVLDSITNVKVNNWDNKVDKVPGKGLSENDFTSTLKSNYDNAVTNSHTHTNKTVLDNFSESGGQLLYSGESISGKTEIDDTQSSTDTTYSSSKIEELIGAGGGGGGGTPNALTKEVVTELPSYENAKDNVLYLIEDTTTPVPAEGLIDDENVSSTTTYSSNKINTLLEGKVSKEAGKGLFSGSYNDLKDVPDNLATTEDLDVLKKSVSDGKTLVASAITSKGVATNPDDSFAVMANNILAIETGGSKIVTWADGTWEEINKMLEAHYAGEINISDYWAVGDERSVDLSAMSATGVGESHRAQTVKFVIGDFDHDDLTTPINGHTKAAITFLQKDCLMDAECEAGTKYGSENTENGYMNDSDTTVGGWNSCARRTWCNDVYYNALPEPLRNMIKPVNKLTSAGNKSSNIITTSDLIFLPSEIELVGGTQYSYTGEGTQYQYYKNATANRYKMPKWSSSDISNIYWQRSPSSWEANFVGLESYYGNPSTYHASKTIGIASCLCI